MSDFVKVIELLTLAMWKYIYNLYMLERRIQSYDKG